MLGASWAYFRYHAIKVVQSLFAGLGVLVVALLIYATFKLGQSVLKQSAASKYRGVLIASLAFLGLCFGHLNGIVLNVGAGLLGLVFYSVTGRSGHHDGPTEPIAPAAPKCVASRRSYVPLLAAVAVALGMTCFPRTRHLFATFFGIGTLAFGGGFAAIPLIQSTVVDHLHWLSLAQFRDGIALGQVTPGPVFITATFIGYKVMGVAGALIATVAIFMPSLAALIALSEVHNAIRNLQPVQAIIRGILAGFIGVLAAVALQFAVTSLVAWQAWLICCGFLTLVGYFKKDVLWAIAGTAVISPLLFR